MHLNMSVKWWPFFLGLNVLKTTLMGLFADDTGRGLVVHDMLFAKHTEGVWFIHELHVDICGFAGFIADFVKCNCDISNWIRCPVGILDMYYDFGDTYMNPDCMNMNRDKMWRITMVQTEYWYKRDAITATKISYFCGNPIVNT